MASPVPDKMARTVATLEIEYLRRLYARACDLICENTSASVAEGRAIYRRIFMPDAEIVVNIDGAEVLRANGPDEWTARVIDALCDVFDATQHLIGTQIVEILTLPKDGSASSGEAVMTSYLQAWHAAKDGMVDIFLGTYHDRIRSVSGVGWQISAMRLERTSGEIRPLQGGSQASFLLR